MRKIASVASTLALTAATLTGMAVTAAPASAASCYGNSKWFNLESTWTAPGERGKYKTTVNCRDINIRPSATVYAKICFFAKSDPERLLYCQDGPYKTAKKGEWTVLAGHVEDGQPFQVRFSADADYAGFVAA
jgi:hypothetical protein